MVHPQNPFNQAEQRYRQLLYQRHNGQLTDAAFQQAQADCVVVDANGRQWFPATEPGRWLYWDGQHWALYTPPSTSAPHRLEKERKRGRGCLVATLILLGFLLIGAGVIIWRSPLAVRWGLRPSPALAMLGAPEREVATELALELKLDRDTPGVFYYVLPISGTADLALYVVADTSLGFDGIKAASGPTDDALINYLIQLAQSETISRSGIKRIALDYRDTDGLELCVVTARTADILDMAEGRMTKEEFLKVLDGRVNLNKLYEGDGQ